MLRAAVTLAVLAATGHVAHAGWAESTFATMTSVAETEVREVADWELPAGSYYQHALVGRYQRGELVHGAVVLLHCDTKQCTGPRAWLQGDIEVLGTIDLAGAPAAFPTSPLHPRYAKLARAKWPALLVRATTAQTMTTKSYTMKDVTGTERRSELHVLSLAKSDTPQLLNEVVDHHYPTGAGVSVTFALAKGTSKRALDIVATEQRSIDRELACIPPDPTTTRYTLVDGRYQRADLTSLGKAGCH